MICRWLRYTTTLLLALIVSGMLNSCIYEDFIDAASSASEEKTVYLSINVKSDSDVDLTRAGGVSDDNGMVDGSHSDHLTTDHIAIFFYENDEQNGPGQLCAITTLGLPATHEDIGTDNPNQKEANYIATVRVTKEDKDKIDKEEIVLPKYCLVILNGGRVKEQLETICQDPSKADYNTIVKEIWASVGEPENIGFNDKGRFTMTNSVYVKDGKAHAAQEISPLNFCSTPDEARLHPVTIYVERMVARFTFEVSSNEMTRADDSGIIITPKEDTAPLVFFDKFGSEETLYKAWPWRVKVTGWGINAQEQNAYLFKNINPTATYFDDWNDLDNKRSYWCEDLHYDYKYDANGNKTTQAWTYPWQYRKAVDKDLESYGEENKVNLLKNYSYNDFTTPGKIGEEVYAPENTYVPSLYTKDTEAYLDDRTSLLAGTHLLVCAEMQVDDGSGFSTPEHIYRDRQGIYYESKAQFFKMFVSTINELLKSQRTMDFVLYDWEKGGQIEVPYKDDEDEEHTTSKLTAKTVNKDVEYSLYYYNQDTDDYTELTDDTIEELIADGTFDMVSATIEYGDGRVLPWFKGNTLKITDSTHEAQLDIWTRDSIYEEAPGYKFIEGKNVTQTINNQTDYDNCIKSLLSEWFGPIDHFNGGKMYYAAPISHNNPKADSAADDTDETDDAEDAEEKLGVYGVVRNCWYHFTLMGINRIGTPVDNPDEPIVPELINIKDVINSKTQLHVRPWHEEETVAPLY